MQNARNNYLYLFGSSFLLKLLAEAMIGPSVYVSLGIVGLFLVGFLILFVLGALSKKPETIAPPPPSIHTEPIREDNVFVDLDRMMDEHHLELRLRRVDGAWQITFTTHQSDGIIRIVGQGSAASILDALIKAEADFLEKTG